MRPQISSAVLLWLSVLLFAASNSIVRVLSDLGTQNPIDGRNPISFCNLLFAGNLCATIALYILYRKHWTWINLRALSRGDWISLTALAILTGALAPWFFFVAIENTQVTSVVLITQIEPPLVLLLSLLFFGERIGIRGAFGACLCVLGVALSILLQPNTNGFIFGKGELFAAAAACLFAISTIIAKPRLERIPLGIFTVLRNAVGTVFFFIVATYVYGVKHFVDLTSPFLWQWMLIYGGIIVVGGQVLWYRGLRTARFVDVSLATSTTPIAGVLAAFLILGERPLAAQYIGGGVLIVGILIGLSEHRQQAAKISEKNVGLTLEAEGRAGFKGV